MSKRGPVEFDHFEPGAHTKWLECISCGKGLNVFDKPTPGVFVFGALTNNPETMTHWCYVSCRCRQTSIRVYGTIRKMVAHGCIAQEKK